MPKITTSFCCACGILLLCGLSGAAHAQTEESQSKAEFSKAAETQCKLPSVRDELAARVDRDQTARMAMIENMKVQEGSKAKTRSDAHAQVMTIDRENKSWILEKIEQHGWLGKSLVGETGAHHAWMLVQHADQDLPFQKKCLSRMSQMPKGEVSPVDIAYLTDRVLAADGKLQRYGTQCSIENGKAVVKSVEDPENLNRRRAELGLEPIEKYLKFVESMYVKPVNKPEDEAANTGPPASDQVSERSQRQADLEFAISCMKQNYAYQEDIELDWSFLQSTYLERLNSVKTKGDFFRLIEQLVEELHDHHAHLNQNNENSFRLVPTSLDIWVDYQEGEYVVSSVRPGSNAARLGIQTGNVVLKIGEWDIADAVSKRLEPFADNNSSFARAWAARTLIAGKQNQSRIKLTLRNENNNRLEFELVAREPAGKRELLSHKVLDDGIHYIRIENSLGDRRLVAKFDAIIDKMEDSSGLVLDLRNTPGGGSSDIARGLMGRLIIRELPYQKHEFVEQPLGIPRIWVEHVRPRGVSQFTGRLVVLCGRWTGSMGEGLVIGLDAMDRATVVGTKMARLKGATQRYVLPNCGIGLFLPVERLFHVDGTPRERYEPKVHSAGDLQQNGDADKCLSDALELLQDTPSR